ncbi:MAG TPA: type II CAAX endopeptidase family protein [Gemmatimonadales bacterium]
MTDPGPAGRISLAKAIGWSIAFVVLTLLLASMLGFGVAMLLRGSRAGALELLTSLGPEAMLLQAIVTLVSAGLFTWLIGFRALGLGPRELRWTARGGGARGFGLGVLIGVLAAGATLVIGVAGGNAEWTRDEGTFGDYLANAALTVGVLAPAALSEEVIFRGVPLVLLASVLGRGAGVVAIAVPFALAHLGNPHLTALGVGNIALAGIFLGLAFYAPGGIWTAWGAHLGWNGLLAALDTPVSGVPFDIPFLDYTAGAPIWLTGGAFGPEGGLAATLALTIAISVAARWAGKEPS